MGNRTSAKKKGSNNRISHSYGKANIHGITPHISLLDSKSITPWSQKSRPNDITNRNNDRYSKYTNKSTAGQSSNSDMAVHIDELDPINPSTLQASRSSVVNLDYMAKNLYSRPIPRSPPSSTQQHQSPAPKLMSPSSMKARYDFLERQGYATNPDVYAKAKKWLDETKASQAANRVGQSRFENEPVRFGTKTGRMGVPPRSPKFSKAPNASTLTISAPTKSDNSKSICSTSSSNKNSNLVDKSTMTMTITEFSTSLAAASRFIPINGKKLSKKPSTDSSGSDQYGQPSRRRRKRRVRRKTKGGSSKLKRNTYYALNDPKIIARTAFENKNNQFLQRLEHNHITRNKNDGHHNLLHHNPRNNDNPVNDRKFPNLARNYDNFSAATFGGLGTGTQNRIKPFSQSKSPFLKPQEPGPSYSMGNPSSISKSPYSRPQGAGNFSKKY